MLVGAHAEVLDGFARVALAAEEDGVRTSRSTHRELVEGQSLAASLQDALLGCRGEAQGSNGQLGNLEETDIIGDCADGDDDLGVAVRGSRSLLHNAGKRDGRAVRLGQEEAVEDRLHNSDSQHHGICLLLGCKSTLLKFASVRLARKRYNCTESVNTEF